MTNQNGLLIDAQGVIRGIEVPISNEPITGLKRVARHESLSIGADMQMIQRIRIVTVNAAGVPLRDALAAVAVGPKLNQLLDRYDDSIFSASTMGAVVSPATGVSVEAGTPGAVEQLAYMQGITGTLLAAKGIANDKNTSKLRIIYMMILSEILSLDFQGRL